ncbi:MAG: hypothetical protein AAF587_38725 [Bacteroidota bacterium]
MNIPEDYTEFLYWIKYTTETNWRNIYKKYGADTDVGWLQGATWTGMSEENIRKAEHLFNIEFLPEHREFLRILHTIDKKEAVTFTNEHHEVQEVEVSFFYDWVHGIEEIKRDWDWPYTTILEDIEGENKVWIHSWGKRAREKNKRERIFSAWFEKAPALIPLHFSKFLVNGKNLADNPILSVRGSDIHVYAWDFRHFLLYVLQDYLDLYQKVYDTEDQIWYDEPLARYLEIYQEEKSKARDKDIPFWKELILYWSSGWSSFGMEYPEHRGMKIRPIVNTYIAEEE